MVDEKIKIAANEGLSILHSCYEAMSILVLPNTKRATVATALAYSSLEQGRAACLLIATDPEHSYFAAIILFRSQLEQLVRAQFFAGPATDKQLQHFLDTDTLPDQQDGQKLGPKSLAKISTSHFGWETDQLTKMIENNWRHLSAFAHGGRAVLNFYIRSDGIGPAEIADDFVEPLINITILGLLAVALAMGLSTNQGNDEVQTRLKQWFDEAQGYFSKWSRAAN